MSSPADTLAHAPEAAGRYGALDRLLRKRLLATLDGLAGGQVIVRDGLGTETLGEAGDGLVVTLDILDPGFYRALAGNGSVGAGEAYMDGLWRCDDLVALVRLLVINRDRLDAMETGLARLGGLAMRALHAFNRNTRGGRSENRSTRLRSNHRNRCRLCRDQMFPTQPSYLVSTQDQRVQLGENGDEHRSPPRNLRPRTWSSEPVIHPPSGNQA